MVAARKGTMMWFDFVEGDPLVEDGPPEVPRMRGTMLWFNEAKDTGFILTEEGERLSVSGDGFAGGKRPKGRCARAVVSFDLTDLEGARCADNVLLLTAESPRRARRRHRSTL